MRLLVITARYPTADRPAAGTFVRERLQDPEVVATVISPSDYGMPGWRRYASIAWRALSTRGSYDGVEGHFLLPTGAIAIAAGRLRRRPVVIYAHGTDVRVTARRGRLNRFLAGWVVRNASAIVTNSEATAADLHELGATAEVVPPGVDLQRFRPTPRPATRRVFYLGGTTTGKGYEVARSLADTLVGPGLTEIAPDRLPQLLSEHDVVLVPSESEGFGLVAAEATAAGRWVVARAVGGLTEVVEPGVTGTLVERDEEFAAAIEAVPDYDPDAVAARAVRFDVRNHWAALADVWTRVLRSGGTAG